MANSNKLIRTLCWIWLVLALAFTTTVRGYDLIKDDSGIYVVAWDPGTISMKVRLATSPALSDGTSQSGSLVAAMQDWNAQLGTVQFSAQELGAGSYDPDSYDNEIAMADTIDGQAFGENTLAVTLSYHLGNARVESDILFNNKWSWDSYRGNLQSSEDIRRVAIHELGHVLGLDHPDQASPPQSVNAIMNSTASNTDALQGDDIAGAQSLYSSPGFRPANDNFSSAETINVVNNYGQANGTNVAATSESGEPTLDADDPGRKTVWWKWTASGNGSVTMTTMGSNFDTLLGVYTGSSVNALTQLALNDDVQSGVVRTSTVAFSVAAGITYYFAVDGWGGYAGAIQLNLAFVPGPIDVAPSIVSQPISQTVTVGQTARFSVSASGSPAPTYQWQRLSPESNWVDLANGGGLSGVTSVTLTINSVASLMMGQRFRCVVANRAGSATSDAATLTVNSPPVITSQPTGYTAFFESTVAFTVAATGTGPFTFQWQKGLVDVVDDGRITGSSTSTLTISGIRESDVGNYRVFIRNSLGGVLSQEATLSVTGLRGVVAASAGYLHGLVIESTGQLSGMGRNGSGELGDGTNIDRHRPVSIATNVVAASAGNYHSLYIKSDGSLWGMGSNAKGALGDGTSGNSRSTSIQIATGVVAAKAGEQASYFIKNDGSLWAMGNNNYHQLGDGTNEIRTTPVFIAADVIAVAAGVKHMLYLKADGTVWAVGSYNSHGQLGLGTTEGTSIPVMIASAVTAIGAGNDHSIFLKADGGLWAFGDIFGGNLDPALVATSVNAISAGRDNAFFIKNDGTLWGFGARFLGNGVEQGSTTPLQIAAGVSAVSGSVFSYFIKTDGTLWDFGYNLSGALGDGTTSDKTSPLRITSVVPAAPASIATLSATQGLNIGVRLTWSAAIGASRYEVWRSSDFYGQNAVRIADTVTPLYYDLTATPGFAYNYYVKAVNTSGGNFGASAVGYAGAPTIPVITTHPSAATTQTGGSIFFSVEATAAPFPTYQWQQLAQGGSTWTDIHTFEVNGAVPPFYGQKTARLQVNTTYAMNGNQYRCVVTNSQGSAASNSALLTVTPLPPTIVNQPVSRVVALNTSLNLSVTASSSVPLTYQWRKDGADISGASGASYSVASAALVDSGHYTVVVTNSAGSVTSSAAVVSVMSPPVITTQPVSRTVAGGNAFSFAVVADSGGGTLSYQWKKGSAVISGATQNTYGKSNALLADIGDYVVVVSNALASVTSNIATLAVTGSEPIITAHPQPVATVVAAAAIFRVVVSADPAPSYQWQVLRVGSGAWSTAVDGAKFSGSQTSTLTVSNVQLAESGDQYRCVVINALGSATSNFAALSVSLAGFTRISAGRYHSLRVDGSGGLFASGTNTDGQIGNGNTINVSAAQRITLAGKTVADVAAGSQHSLFLTTSKELYATGYNVDGRLGDGTLVSKSTPVKVASDVAGMAAGFFHTAYLKTDGTLWTVGGNDSGQLGDGTTTNRSTAVQIATGVVDLAAGIRQTLFVKSDGTLWAVGNLDGSDNFVTTPVQIATQVAKVAAGGYHSLFIKTDGTLWSMGYNATGQLGDGSTTTRTTPVQIASGVKTVTAGYFHSLFIKTDESLWAMGNNGGGQIGDGTIINRSAPVQVTMNVAVVSASEGYTLFAKNDGSLWGTGYNAYGQFGNASTATTNVPVQISSGLMLAPAQPVDVSSALIDSGRVRLTWQSSADVVSYEVWRNATNDSATATRIASGVRWAIYEDINAGAGVAYYWIKAVNPAGTSGFSAGVNGSGAVVAAPVIVTAPQSQSVSVGASATFSVIATGEAPLSYQWRKNGDAIPSATSASYTINPTVMADAGDYSVTVANAGGSVTSSLATLVVNKLAQTINFEALLDRTYTTTAFSISATTSSGLPVVFTVVSGPATIAGAEVTLTGVGTVLVRASQAGSAIYNAAISSERSFVVSKATATVTLADLTSTYSGAPHSVTATTLPVGLNLIFSYDGGASVPTNAGNYSVTATVNEANYQGSASDTLVIAKAAQTITFSGPANQVFSATPITLSATASSGLPVSFAMVSGPAALSGATLTLNGSGIVTLRVTQAGDANYEPATPVEQDFEVMGNFAAWQHQKFTSAELLNLGISGASADPDGDGFANLIEYALGFEPNVPTTDNLPALQANSNEWRYTYLKPADRADVTCVVEVSVDLSTWTTVNVSHELISTVAGLETWQAIYPVSSANAFFRIKATLP